MGKFTVYRIDKYGDEFDEKIDSVYSNERDASIRARCLYLDGAYSVKVQKPDGTESLQWAKPIEEFSK